MATSTPVSNFAQFDLREFRSADKKWKQVALYVVVAGALGLSLEVLALVVPDLGALEARGLSTQSGQFFLFGIFVVILAISVCLIILPRQLSGAELLGVDDYGVHLRYPRGREDHFRWSSPGLLFTLYDYSSYKSEVELGGAYIIFGPHVWRRRSLISKEAFDSMLTRARARGAKISTYSGNPAWYGKSPVIHRVHGALKF